MHPKETKTYVPIKTRAEVFIAVVVTEAQTRSQPSCFSAGKRRDKWRHSPVGEYYSARIKTATDKHDSLELQVQRIWDSLWPPQAPRYMCTFIQTGTRTHTHTLFKIIKINLQNTCGCHRKRGKYVMYIFHFMENLQNECQWPSVNQGWMAVCTSAALAGINQSPYLI